jgi:FtsP/CotA-like multicopper oxidase with cupredoxin domain
MRTLSRREFLVAGAGAAGALAAGGYGLSRLLSDSGDGADVVLRAQAETVEHGGRTVRTWTYGSGVPGPEIRVRQGQRLRVRVENALPEETTVHWHGIRLENEMDGVPDMPLPAIRPGESFVYHFAPPVPGPDWFHPHVGMQLDRGLNGALVVEPRDEPLSYDREATLVLDDWLDGLRGTPDAALDRLLAEGMHMPGMSGMDHGGMHDMSGMEMGFGMGLGGMDLGGLGDGSLAVPGRYVTLGGDDPLSGTLPALGNLLAARQLDAGDVQFPLYLVNGRPPTDPFAVDVRRGDRVRLRLVNAAADTLFAFSVDDHPLTVVASDGQPVDPLETDAVLLGMGERVDVLLDARAPGAHRMLATPLGKTGRALAILRYLGTTGSAPAPTAAVAKPGRMVSYEDLRSSEAAPTAEPSRSIRMDLAMDMSRPYRWTMGGQAFPEAEPVRVGLGEQVRFVIRNRTMMAHPMHIHGHFFRDSSAAANGPLKDTVLVPPQRTVALDLVASNPGHWMFHCHNLYHQSAGMMRVVEVGH